MTWWRRAGWLMDKAWILVWERKCFKYVLSRDLQSWSTKSCIRITLAEGSHTSRFLGPFLRDFDLVDSLWGPRTHVIKKHPDIILIPRYIWKAFDLKLFSDEEVNQNHQKKIIFSPKHRCLHGHMKMRERERDGEGERWGEERRRENILIIWILK